MLIDWTTVAFQLFNFLLLVVLLKRFLYGPITRAMDRREEELTEIRDEASRLRAEAEAQRDQWRQALHSQQREFLAELQQRSVTGVLTLARRALAELTDESLEKALARELLTRLRELPEPDQARFLAAARSGRLVARGGFAADEDLRHKLEQALGDKVGAPIELAWEESPDATLDIEIIGDGRRLAWGVSGYLEEVRERVRKLFDGQGRVGVNGTDAPMEEP